MQSNFHARGALLGNIAEEVLDLALDDTIPQVWGDRVELAQQAKTLHQQAVGIAFAQTF